MRVCLSCGARAAGARVEEVGCRRGCRWAIDGGAGRVDCQWGRGCGVTGN